MARLRLTAADPFALLVWVAMSGAAAFFVARYGTLMPELDDLTQVGFLNPGFSPDWGWAWSQHNEHRIPIPRALYYALVRISGDFRTGTYAEVALLSALSAALILAARRVRGRASFADAVFPLLLLHWGHAENLLNSFQIQVALSTALTGAILITVASARSLASPGTLALCGALLFLLPLCGMFGVLQVPVLTAWLAYAGLAALRSPSPRGRVAAWVAFAAVAALAALAAAYFSGFGFLPGFRHAGPLRTLSTSTQFLAQAFGFPASDSWPLSGLLALAVLLAAAGLLAGVLRTKPEQRVRAAGLLAVLAATVSLAVGVGYGRGMDQEHAGFLSRYGLLAAPAFCASHLAWAAYGRSRAERVAGGVLFALTLLAAVANLPPGVKYGRERARRGEAFLRDAREGLTLRELAGRHWRALYYDEGEFLLILESMAALELGPFSPAHAGNRRPEPSAWPFHMMRARPIAVVSPRGVEPSDIEGRSVLLVHPDGELRFAPQAGAQRIRGWCGVKTKEFSRGESSGLRFSVEVDVEGSAPAVLWEATLDPRRRAEDREPLEFSVPLPADAAEVVLRARAERAELPDVDWSYWTGVEFR